MLRQTSAKISRSQDQDTFICKAGHKILLSNQLDFRLSLPSIYRINHKVEVRSLSYGNFSFGLFIASSRDACNYYIQDRESPVALFSCFPSRLSFLFGRFPRIFGSCNIRPNNNRFHDGAFLLFKLVSVRLASNWKEAIKMDGSFTGIGVYFLSNLCRLSN